MRFNVVNISDLFEIMNLLIRNASFLVIQELDVVVGEYYSLWYMKNLQKTLTENLSAPKTFLKGGCRHVVILFPRLTSPHIIATYRWTGKGNIKIYQWPSERLGGAI